MASHSRRGHWRHRPRAQPEDPVDGLGRRLDAPGRRRPGPRRSRDAVGRRRRRCVEGSVRPRQPRLDFEREQLEAERRRAERALQLELLRQSVERDIARLRLLAGVDLVAWLSSLLIAVRGLASGVGARVTLGAGWLLLLAALAASFNSQSAVARALEHERAPSQGMGAVALWLTVAGLALVAISVLV